MVRAGHGIRPPLGRMLLPRGPMPIRHLHLWPHHGPRTAVPLHVVATSLRTGREVWFSTGPVIEAILASAALPGVFPPVELDGDAFIDGGVVDNVPMSRAFELRVPSVYVLHPGNFARPRPQPRRPVDVLLQAFSIARNHRFFSEADAPPEGVELIKL